MFGWEPLHLLSHQHHGFLRSCPLATAVQTYWKPQLCCRSLTDRAGLYSCAPGSNLNLTLWGYTQGKSQLGSLGRTTNRQWWLPQMLISTEEQNHPQAWAWFQVWSRSCARALSGDGSQPQLRQHGGVHLWCSQTLKERRNCFLSFLSGKNKNIPPKHGRSVLFFRFFVEWLHLHVAAFLHI